MEWRFQVGTAFDLWMSLHVLHHPQDFGLRRPWAAGVRARLPEPEKQILAEVTTAMPLPFPWIALLPGSKSARHALEVLQSMPPAERLLALFVAPDTPPGAAKIWHRVAQTGQWEEADIARLQEHYAKVSHPSHKLALEKRLTLFARGDEVGKTYLQALNTYHRVFFAEEEERILPALEKAAGEAKRLVATTAPQAALENLTQGLSIKATAELRKIILAPSYWITPLVVFRRLAEDTGLLVFGARPQNASLVPGEEIPTAIQHGLRALDNPTRLRILRYLAEAPATPSQLARRLRLRLPTVLHHLHLLRLAGLVSLNLGGGERLYAARLKHLDEIWQVLQHFLQEERR